MWKVILFLGAGATLFYAVYAAGLADSPRPMMYQHAKDDPKNIFLGKYELASDTKSEDFNELLKTMEFSDPARERIRGASFIIVEIKVRNQSINQWEYKIKSNMRQVFSVFIPGVEFDDTLFDGRHHKAVVKMESDTVLTRDEVHKGFTCHHVMEFNHSGFNVTFTATKKERTTTCRQVFIRVSRDSYFDMLGK